MNRKTARLTEKIVFIIAIAACAARAGEGERLIRFPLQTFPAIVQKGSDFEVKLTGKTDEGLKISLLLHGNEFPLKIESAAYENGISTVKVRAPDNLPEELYDLKAAAAESETQKHAVKVVPAFRKDYYFIHLTDAHIRRTDYSYFHEVADEINLINPEFVILTGDIVVNVEDMCRTLKRSTQSLANYLGDTSREEILNIIENEYETFFRVLDELRVPVYVIPGNHDTPGPLNPLCREIWERHFLYRYFSFDYGNDHFVGLDNSQMFEVALMIYPEAKPEMAQDFEAEQIQWLESDLGAHNNTGLKTIFFHCPLFGENSAINDIVSRYGIDLVLLGHHHVDMVWRQGGGEALWVKTRDARLGYRLIRVRDGGLAGWGSKKSSHWYRKKADPLTMLPPGARKEPAAYALDIGKLRVVYDGPNDGTRETLSARITNDLGENFENAMLKIPMKKGAYEVSGGTLVQSVAAGDMTIVYVSVSIPAGGESEVAVKKSEKP